MWQSFGRQEVLAAIGMTNFCDVTIPLSEEWEIVRLRAVAWPFDLTHVYFSVNRDERMRLNPCPGNQDYSINDKIQGAVNIRVDMMKYTANNQHCEIYLDVIRKVTG